MSAETAAAAGQGLKSRKRKPRPHLPKPAVGLPIAHQGRPEKYDPYLAPRVHKLVLLGLTDAEIADFLGIAASMPYIWRRRHPECSDALRAGRDEGRREAGGALCYGHSLLLARSETPC